MQLRSCFVKGLATTEACLIGAVSLALPCGTVPCNADTANADTQ
jgi:hypothetical protein